MKNWFFDRDGVRVWVLAVGYFVAAVCFALAIFFSGQPTAPTPQTVTWGCPDGTTRGPYPLDEAVVVKC